MGPIGVQEMIAIFLVALILFGPKKLPELGRMVGKGLSEFRRAKNELKATLETHLHELERETRASDSPTTNTAGSYSPASYPHPYEDYGRRSYDSSSTWGSQENAGAIAAPTAAAEPENGDALQQLAAPESAPVAGTVPRSNGVHSGDPVTASTELESTL